VFDKENADKTEEINAFMGMRHRSAPYVLNNPDDLKQAFLLTDYDTASWLNMDRIPDKTDELATDAACVMAGVSDIFWQLIERAEKNYAMIIKAILSAPPNVQEYVPGKAYSIPAEELDSRIKELFEGLDEIDLYYQMEKNRDAFLKLMETIL